MAGGHSGCREVQTLSVKKFNVRATIEHGKKREEGAFPHYLLGPPSRTNAWQAGPRDSAGRAMLVRASWKAGKHFMKKQAVIGGLLALALAAFLAGRYSG